MDQTVLITGASQGIGLATSKLLADSGASVVGIARSHPEGDFPGEFYPADLSSRAETAQVMERITANHSVNCVVNNVGFNVVERLGEVDLDHFDRVIDLNVRTAIQITQFGLPGMLNQKYGRIVNVSSRGALGRERAHQLWGPEIRSCSA